MIQIHITSIAEVAEAILVHTIKLVEVVKRMLCMAKNLHQKP